MMHWRQAAGFALAACLLGFSSGCVTRGALIQRPAGQAVELSDTPFFPQRAHQCGPAALATVLAASQVSVTPDELVPLVYLPQKRGSLQIEMLAAPRKYTRLAYTLESELDAILSELDAGRSVLVLHNYGLPMWPRWHYAVIVGYDPTRDTVVLRSGTTRRQVLSARNFMRAWDNGGRWALVVLRPGELPANADKARYLEAAVAFERVADSRNSLLAFDAAVKRWPDEPVAWIGRGTASYRNGDLSGAARDYAQALGLDGSHAGARNNYAMTLLDLGCRKRALEELEKINLERLSGPLLVAVQDTRSQIEARAPAPDTESCRLRLD